MVSDGVADFNGKALTANRVLGVLVDSDALTVVSELFISLFGILLTSSSSSSTLFRVYG